MGSRIGPSARFSKYSYDGPRLRGPTGPSGTGATGPSGATGASGVTGASGPTGPAFPTLTFGSGSDGPIVLDGVNLPAWANLTSPNVYTVVQDAFPSTVVVNLGVTLITAGYRIYASVSFTNNGTVNNDGSPGVTVTGGAGGLNGTLGGGGAGGNGAGASFHNGGPAPIANGGIGGGGGHGGAGLGGHAGGATGARNTVTAGGTDFQFSPVANMGVMLLANGAGTGSIVAPACGGPGGGSGGSDPESNAGAGGGGGGGVVFLCAKSLINSGTISAQGGAGAAATLGQTGGGGAGGGIILISESFANTGTLTTASGAGGAGIGGGAAGTTGGAGSIYQLTDF